tara:strand:+ start:1635 stop:3176 length:1542 start_codon:yes stop_codon:yes gene_type:complete
MSSLQQTGAISLNQIAAEFGVTSGARSLTDFYRGGSNVSATETVTSSATNAPSDDNPVSNFANVTGLTCTRTTTTSTSTSVGGFVQVGSTVVGSSGTILSPPSVNNAQGNPTRLARVRNQSTGAQPVIERVESNFGSSPQLTSEESNNANISSGGVSSSVSVPGNSLLFFKVRFSGAGGPSNQRVSTEVQSLVTTTTNTVTYSFTNNSSYAVTIVGATTETVQVGETITTVLPDSNNQYTCSYTPVSNDQTENASPPTSDSPVSDFGGITGLTCTKTASDASSLSNTQTTQTVTLTAGVTYNFTAAVTYTKLSASQEQAFGGYQMGSDRADSGVTVGVSVNASGSGNPATNRDRGTFYNGVSQGTSFTGQPLLAVTDLARGGGRHAGGNPSVTINITVQGTPSANTVLTFYPNASSSPSRQGGNSTFSSQTLTNSIASLYNFTNNTGFPVTISGSGVTTTTIPNGGTNNESLSEPSGNFTIQYQVANPQALNGNIPTSGAISFTDFYGTEDFT